MWFCNCFYGAREYCQEYFIMRVVNLIACIVIFIPISFYDFSYIEVFYQTIACVN